MERVDKGMYLDGSSETKPRGSWSWMNNGNPDRRNSTHSIEEGFSKHLNKINGTTQTSFDEHLRLIGNVSINTDWQALMLVATHTSETDEIGLIDKYGNYTTTIKDDVLNFSTRFPINGKGKLNSKRERIIVFTDDNNEPKMLNFDDLPFDSGLNVDYSLVSSDEITSMNLFRNVQEPDIIVNNLMDTGGVLPTGSYMATVCYEDSDGTLTSYLNFSNPVNVNSESKSRGFNQYDGEYANTISTKAIEFKLENLDTNFSYFHIVMLRRVNGNLSAVKLDGVTIPETGNTYYTYTGNETGTTVSLTDLLTDSVSFKKIGKFETYQHSLLGVNIEGEKDLGYQKYANSIKVDYGQAKTVKTRQIEGSYKDEVFVASNKMFMNEETYALYIGFKMKKEGYSYAYHIPGRKKAIINGIGSYQEDTLASTLKGDASYMEKDEEINSNVRYYQTRCTGFNPNADTNMGLWINMNEQYPTSANDEDGNWEIWDSGGDTGETLHGENVRHHRIPSLRTIFDNDGDYYSQSSGDYQTYGLIISNIFIPEEIRDKIEGYEIFYAKRDENNSIIQGQSLAFHSWESNSGIVRSVGGNFNPPGGELKTRHIRFHSFDMLKDRPNLLSTFMTFPLLFHKAQIELHNGHYDGDSNLCYERRSHFDYSSDYKILNRYISTNDNYLRYIEQLQYIPNNNDELVYNNNCEAVIKCENPTSGPDLGVVSSDIETGANNKTYLANMCIWREDCYIGFDKQSIVSTGKLYRVSSGTSIYNNTEPLLGGDTYLNDYSIRLTAIPNRDVDDVDDSNLYRMKMLYTFLVQSKNHIGFRNEGTEADEMYYPKLNDGAWDKDDFLKRDVEETNYLWSNSDYKMLNEYHGVFVKPTISTEITDNYNRIYKSSVGTEEMAKESWRTFLANNYYDLPSTKDEITNVEVFANELLIHTKKSLFKTVGSKTLKADEITTYIGSGSLFSMEPQEQSITEEGFAGLQGMQASVMTPRGYYFANQLTGRVFHYDGKLHEIASIGGIEWFRKNMISTITKQVGSKLGNDYSDYMKMDNTVSDYVGIGVLASYDPKYDRVIFTNHDYEITTYGLSLLRELDAYLEDPFELGLVITEDGFYEALGNSLSAIQLLSNTTYFTDNSFTISFSTRKNHWNSFHSYKPLYSFIFNEVLLSTSGDRSLNEHDVRGVYGQYEDEGVYEDFDIDIPVALGDEKVIMDSVSWTSRVYSNGRNIFDKTFDKIAVYNRNQCTGLEDIIHLSTTRNIQGDFFFNKIRDKVNNENSVFISDKYVIDDSKIDNSLRWFKQNLLTGGEFGVKLVYENDSNQRDLEFEKIGFNLTKIGR